ncbi:MAG: 2,3-bisphosphoglycerate-independent phosphoglycerate mutase, partial [Holosporales bacterium]
PSPEHNAIALAQTPHWDHLWANFPHALLETSGEAVGLPEGQMGNSEVGHMTIGAGRVIYQDLPRIDRSLRLGELPTLTAFQDLISKAKEGSGVVHMMGLLSPGGVHSHQAHFEAIAKLFAQAGLRVWVHAFTDGRDTPPTSGRGYLRDFLAAVAAEPAIQLATLGGRYYGMDRDQRWERVQVAYEAMVAAKGPQFSDPLAALEAAYAQGITDEFIPPMVTEGYPGIQTGDALFCVNFRADRVRQILTALLDPQFEAFPRASSLHFSTTLGMASYSTKLTPFMPALFPPQQVHNSLGEVVAAAHLPQLRIAETEKYAHVTFFFNGGREEVFEGEDRILIPSPKVATYDLQPEMSAEAITDQVDQALQSGTYGLIVLNFANPDMVGHTGIEPAAIRAVETIDACLGRLFESIRKAEGAMLITADHGNVEEMIDTHGQPLTSHTTNPVPVILVSDRSHLKDIKLVDGTLADVAPTILEVMGIGAPKDMTGRSLISQN